MPRRGYKAITVSEWIYETAKEQAKLRNLSISSFISKLIVQAEKTQKLWSGKNERS